MLSVCICTFNCLCYCQCKPALILANAFIHCLQLAGCPVQCMTGIYTYNKSINVELSTLTGYTKINMCVCVCVCVCHFTCTHAPNEVPPGHCGCDSVGYAAQS